MGMRHPTQVYVRMDVLDQPLSLMFPGALLTVGRASSSGAGAGSALGKHAISATRLPVGASGNTPRGVGLDSFAPPPLMVRVGASKNSSTQDPCQTILNHHSENKSICSQNESMNVSRCIISF